MSILDANSLECTLPELDAQNLTLDKRYAMSLRSNHNQDEVQHFVQWVSERLFTYQFSRFYDYMPTIKKEELTTKVELCKDYDNRMGDKQETIWRFYTQIQTSITNEFPKKNNGPEQLDNVKWIASLAFLDIHPNPEKLEEMLPKACVINTEDITFNKPGADFFARAVAGVLTQKYAQEFYPELFKRNFMIIEAAAPEFANPFMEMLKKQRDLQLDRAGVEKHLKSIKCLKTDKTLDCILDKDFSLV